MRRPDLEPTPAQLEALAEAVHYLEGIGCSQECVLLTELEKRGKDGDRHAAYLASVIGELSHIRIDVRP